MLQAMRSGAKSILLKIFLFGLLLLAMLGMAFTDVQGMFRGGVSNANVARVAGENISIVQFGRDIERVLRQQNIPAADAYKSGMVRQYLEQDIDSRILARAAHAAGIVIDDKRAAREVKQVIAPLVKQGMNEKEAFSRILQANNMTESSLVSMVKSQLSTQALLSAIGVGIAPPQQMIDDAFAFRFEKRRGEYFTVAASALNDLKAPTEEDIKAHYDGMSNRFMLPEFRSFRLAVIDPSLVGKKTVTDADVRKYYDDNKSEFALPARVSMSQLILQDEEKAKAIADAVKGGKPLAEAAGELKLISGEFVPADLPGEVADALEGKKDGEVAGPVKSPMGFHLIQVNKRLASGIKDFDKVKAEIRAHLTEGGAADELYELANAIDDKIAGGAALEEVAAENKLKIVSFDKLTSGGKDRTGKVADKKSLPAFEKALAAAFKQGKGEAGQLIETGEGGYLIAEVTEVIPAQKQPLIDIRADVVSDLKMINTAKALDTLAGKIMERLNLGEKFEDVAKEYGAQIRRTDMVTREGSPSLPRGIAPALFSIDKKGQSTAVGAPDSVTILRLADRSVDMPEKIDDKEKDAMRLVLMRSIQNDLMGQLNGRLRDEYNVRINDVALERAFARSGDDTQTP